MNITIYSFNIEVCNSLRDSLSNMNTRAYSSYNIAERFLRSADLAVFFVLDNAEITADSFLSAVDETSVFFF